MIKHHIKSSISIIASSVFAYYSIKWFKEDELWGSVVYMSFALITCIEAGIASALYYHKREAE